MRRYAPKRTGRNLDLQRDRVVLLFYQDFERDSFLPYDRYLKRLVRPVYQRLSRGPKATGFSVWCQLLVRALDAVGCEVHLNDYALARRNPHYPVGLIGYPSLLDGWSLPNPAVLGPALFDHPRQAPGLLDDPRFQRYLVTCEWMLALFRPSYGERCGLWYAGMDVAQWPDTRGHPKTTDVLIYDKLRWQRELREAELLNPIVAHLRAAGLSYEIIRYRRYDHDTYRAALSRARAMVFLCEHETQGMAYQEALTSNVPVLAWNNGWWLDPRRPDYEPEPVPASSVPYFSPACGEQFTDFGEFPSLFGKFWANLGQYRPRDYVQAELSLQGSAELYLRYYSCLAAEASGTTASLSQLPEQA